VRPATFIPETKTAASLLREFKRTKTHIAIVVDEYGGVAGLVTLEDLLEEIIGEIRDKGDAVPLYHRIDARRHRVRGRMEITEFNRLFNTAITDQASTTIGGFIVNHIGRIAREGYSFRYGDLLFTISSADRTRIREIIVEREEPP
jgi:magnesium and cobalt transporter